MNFEIKTRTVLTITVHNKTFEVDPPSHFYSYRELIDKINENIKGIPFPEGYDERSAEMIADIILVKLFNS
jgi:hypothetical protein